MLIVRFMSTVREHQECDAHSADVVEWQHVHIFAWLAATTEPASDSFKNNALRSSHGNEQCPALFAM